MNFNALRLTKFGATTRQTVVRSFNYPIHLQRRLITEKSTHSIPVRKSNKFRATVAGLAIVLPAIYFSGYFSGFEYTYTTTSNEQLPAISVLDNDSLDWKSKALKPITVEKAEAWLKEGEKAEKGSKGSGVREWYTTSRPSNAICEDNFVETRYRIPSPGDASTQPWQFWGVFDGHAGSQASNVLKETLVPYVVRSLTKLYQGASNPDSSSISAAIKSAFLLLDNEFITTPLEMIATSKTTASILSSLASAYSGSVAILTMYNPNTRDLHVACTGDSRAVLGRKTENKYSALPLSIDQTGFLPSEVMRVNLEHPGEVNIINPKSGRMLDRLAPSRAFGDGVFKWELATVKELQARFFGYPPLPNSKTPPYVTASPECTTTRIESGKGDFMIIASDGFWDHISSPQAVKLVEMWIDARKSDNFDKDRVWLPEGSRQLGWKEERKMRDEDFVVWDRNVATHLVRNAFGGRDRDVFLGVIGPKPPMSREIRDDITIQVVFFD